MNNNTLKFKAILWDFDGVIFDSMNIKGDGFRELFRGHSPEQIDEMIQYHYAHGGVSRFEKIRYFYREILHRDISDEVVKKQADRFAKIIKNKLYDASNLIPDTVTFIQKHYHQYDFHIVSGAEHNELNDLCRTFDLARYFISINGSPTKKEDLIKEVMRRYAYHRDEVALIGDAMTDYHAAIQNGIHFYGYNNNALKQFDYIESFGEW